MYLSIGIVLYPDSYPSLGLSINVVMYLLLWMILSWEEVWYTSLCSLWLHVLKISQFGPFCIINAISAPFGYYPVFICITVCICSFLKECPVNCSFFFSPWIFPYNWYCWSGLVLEPVSRALEFSFDSKNIVLLLALLCVLSNVGCNALNSLKSDMRCRF